MAAEGTGKRSDLDRAEERREEVGVDGASRRRLVKIGLAAIPVIVTLKASPLRAGTHGSLGVYNYDDPGPGRPGDPPGRSDDPPGRRLGDENKPPGHYGPGGQDSGESSRGKAPTTR